jgi:hypothetical protein
MKLINFSLLKVKKPTTVCKKTGFFPKTVFYGLDTETESEPEPEPEPEPETEP